MDNEELLLDNWTNFWTIYKKNKIAKKAIETKNIANFTKPFWLINETLIATSSQYNYSHLNRYTLSLFIQAFNEVFSLVNKKVMVLENLVNKSFVVETFEKYIQFYDASIYLTKKRTKTPNVLVKEFANRVNVDYIFYIFEQNNQVFVEFFNKHEEKNQNKNLLKVIEIYPYQAVENFDSKKPRYIWIDQDLIVEDYTEKLIEQFAGPSLYDEQLVKIYLPKSKTQYLPIFKTISKNLKWNIKFIRNYNKNWFTRTWNTIFIKWFAKPDLFITFYDAFNIPRIEIINNSKYKKISSNELVGSYLEHFLEENKRNNDSKLRLVTDNSINNFVVKILDKFQNNIDNNKHLFFAKEQNFYTISKFYEKDNIPFLFKYITYINYLKNQNINFFYKWKSLYKIYGDFYSFEKQFKWSYIEKDDFILPLKDNFESLNNFNFEIIQYSKEQKEIIEMFKIVFENNDFALISYDHVFKKYIIQIEINKFFGTKKTNYKKRAKTIYKLIYKSMKQAS